MGGLADGILFCCFVAFATLSLLNVITRVFVDNAIKSANDDRSSHMLSYVKAIFEQMDADSDGKITWKEFQRQSDTPAVKMLFEQMEMDVAMAQGVFHLLDWDESGEISLREFLGGCLKLCGPARSLDVVLLMRESQHMCSRLDRLMGMIANSVVNFEDDDETEESMP